MSDWLEVNRANWDDRTSVHLGSRFYDVAGWLERGDGPDPYEAALLGDVTAQRLVHLQCHFGLDTLAWARAGAIVTGLDFSEPAIAAATELARRAGLSERARFVVANVFEAPRALGERFDVVYSNIGALCWLPSIERWADVVAALLAPGARLLVHDVHPLLMSLDEDGTTPAYSYFEESEPIVEDSELSYVDGGHLEHTTSYQWNHSLGEIVTALLSRGLVISHLEEHDWVRYQAFAELIEAPAGFWRAPSGTARRALSFSLLATAP